MKYYVYRVNKEGDGDIYGRFNTLSEAKLSAQLLMIQDMCFIMPSDISRLYFYENDVWDYDLLTEFGKLELFKSYPKPDSYIEQ